MKINPTPSTLVNQSAVPTITSRVDPEGARRIMEMLVNLYSDQRLAVAREYVSNAVDATRAAGSTDPVVVTTPTHDEPNLIVTDRGIGMSFAEVEAAFLAFAASTKRNSNDMIGGLGVGAKSAWTLAEAFLIDTVKDGKQTTVRAARNLEHQVLLSDVPSQEPNGTTVIIPVKVDSGGYGSNAESTWKNVVQEVACAHDPGAVRVDGKVVDSIAAGPRIGPVLCTRPRSSWSNRFLIRSGGTLFDTPGSDIDNVISRATQLSGCVVELPIGSFDHTPSRESVIATERTKAAINTVLKQFKRDYEALNQRISLLASTDIGAAIKLRAESLGTVGSTQLLPIPYKLTAPAGSMWLHSSKHSTRQSWTRSELDTDFEFDALNMSSELARTIVVSDVPSGKTLSQFARFLRDNHGGVNRIVTVPQNRLALELTVRHRGGNQPTGQIMSISDKTSGIAHHYTFDQWTAALAAGRSSRGPIQGYTCIIGRPNGSSYEDSLSAADILALGLPVIYKDDIYESWRHVNTAVPSVTVYLGNRKIGPLLRAIPTAMTPQEWRDQQAAALTSNLSPAELLGVVYNSSRCKAYQAALDVAARAALTTTLVGLAGITNGYSQHAQHPKHALLTKIASLVDQAKKTTVRLDDSLTYSMDTQYGAIEKLHNELIKAYPLLNFVKKDNRHYVDYVIHTPPIGV